VPLDPKFAHEAGVDQMLAMLQKSQAPSTVTPSQKISVQSVLTEQAVDAASRCI
jgi:hypothetical protein